MFCHRIACKTSLGTKNTCSRESATAVPKCKSRQQLRSTQRFAAGVSTFAPAGPRQIRHGRGESLHLTAHKGNHKRFSTPKRMRLFPQTQARRAASPFRERNRQPTILRSTRVGTRQLDRTQSMSLGQFRRDQLATESLIPSPGSGSKFLRSRTLSRPQLAEPCEVRKGGHHRIRG